VVSLFQDYCQLKVMAIIDVYSFNKYKK